MNRRTCIKLIGMSSLYGMFCPNISQAEQILPTHMKLVPIQNFSNGNPYIYQTASLLTKPEIESIGAVHMSHPACLDVYNNPICAKSWKLPSDTFKKIMAGGYVSDTHIYFNLDMLIEICSKQSATYIYDVSYLHLNTPEFHPLPGIIIRGSKRKL